MGFGWITNHSPRVILVSKTPLVNSWTAHPQAGSNPNEYIKQKNLARGEIFFACTPSGIRTRDLFLEKEPS